MDLTALWECAVSASCLVTQTTAGLIAGLLLFLVASSLTLIFGVLGFVNFVHGSFYMIGAYFAYTAYSASDSYVLAIAAGGIWTRSRNATVRFAASAARCTGSCRATACA